MIINSLCDTAVCEKINPLLALAFDYLKGLDLNSVETGKVVLAGGDVVVMVNETEMKSQEAARMEIHDEFIDIHVPVSRSEGFSWRHRSSLKQPSEPFDKEKDAQHYEDEPELYFDLPPGKFVIFSPHDGHAGCIGEGVIRKIVVKVRCAGRQG